MENNVKIGVLLVDDERDLLESMARALERRGLAVTVAENAASARAALAKDPTIPVAVIDVRLPDGDGHDLFLELKSQYPDLQGIVLTGNRDDNKSFRLSHQGLFEYLDKPCEAETLARTVVAAFERGREEKENPAAAPAGEDERIRVLLIDDEEDYLNSLARVLSRRGMLVHKALNGEEGIAVFEREQVDVAVIDLKMPGRSGTEVLRELRRRRPEVQAIILTGHATVESGIEGMKEGAVDYLFKPQDPDDLARRIQFAASRMQPPGGKRKWWPFGKK
jgi:DNA-binding NtrC family response regulator